MVINERNIEMFERFFRGLIGYDDIYAWADDKLEENKELINYVLGDSVKDREFKWLHCFFAEIIYYLLSNENGEENFIEYLEDLGRLYYLHRIR